MRPPDLHELRRSYPSIEAYAGSRLVTLEDGGGRGLRLLEMRSGGGLDLEITVDRGFDIGRLAIDGTTISWHSPNGIRSPWATNPQSDRGRGFLRGLSGFLATCGFDHIRQPETDRLDDAPLHPVGEVDYPLHGSGSGQPASLTGHGLDDSGSPPCLWAEAEVVQSTLFLGTIALRRRITVPLGGTSFIIQDRVKNIGPFPMTHMMLYHFNLGYPLVSAGTTIYMPGARQVWSSSDHDALARFEQPSKAHSADLSVFRMPDDGQASCVISNTERQLAISFRFDPSALPYLQLLRMGGEGLYGAGIEPCTTGCRTRSQARKAEEMIFLRPGDARIYTIEISLSRTPSIA
jgi:hypothetical protein